jgi:hypothetical protein
VQLKGIKKAVGEYNRWQDSAMILWDEHTEEISCKLGQSADVPGYCVLASKTSSEGSRIVTMENIKQAYTTLKGDANRMAKEKKPTPAKFVKKEYTPTLYQEETSTKIISQLRNNQAPWQHIGGNIEQCNALNSQRYYGINQLQLLSGKLEKAVTSGDPRWCSLEQIQRYNKNLPKDAPSLHLIKGAKSVVVQQWIFNEYNKETKAFEKLDVPRPVYPRVFHASQISGLAEYWPTAMNQNVVNQVQQPSVIEITAESSRQEKIMALQHEIEGALLALRTGNPKLAEQPFSMEKNNIYADMLSEDHSLIATITSAAEKSAKDTLSNAYAAVKTSVQKAQKTRPLHKVHEAPAR